jgi:predicted lysophospholipase L1 biosynthesis ABC-type transport system permease subunit
MPTRDDRLDNHPSVVINEALAKRYWPNGDPIGEDIYLGAPDNRLFDRATIVGIVGNTRDAGLRADPLPEVFIPDGVMPTWSQLGFVVRTPGDPSSVVAAVRAAMRDVVPGRPLTSVRTMDDVMKDAAAPDRLALTLLGTLAAVAVSMAALGVFGVLAYVVAQRRRELGIRLALGAAGEDVRRLVVLQGLRMAGAGVVIGLAGALALSRVMTGFLYGIRSTDPLTYTAVALLLLAIALVASWIPAMRATRVDPMIALRQG